MLFKFRKRQKEQTALGLDIGRSSVKAAVLARLPKGLQLTQYSMRPLPRGTAKSHFEQHLTDTLAQLAGEMRVQDHPAYVSLSCSSATVCLTDFPRMPLAEVRSALRLNSARYLRRDLANYYMDVAELPESPADGKPKKGGQMKVLVAGASKDEVQPCRDALQAARIRPAAIELGAVSVINAFQVTQPEVCEKETVLVVDIGSHTTTINFLQHGQPQITRLMHFGGQQLSEYVAQMLTLDPADAEEEKLKMSEPVQALLKTAMSPLARELRSSIDFFERQHECRLSRAFACGGSACSERLLSLLGEEVGMRIERWNPMQVFDISHFNGDGQNLMALAPSLAVAVGAAAARV
jgi:type IV pilus assembly protein PilM